MIFFSKIKEGKRKKKIFYLHDGADWALEWVARGIDKYYRNDVQFDFQVDTTFNGIPLGSILHFGSRYEFFDNDPKDLSTKYKIVLTWLHGKYDSPEFHELFMKLKVNEPYIAKIVTSCLESKEELLHAGIPLEKIVLIPLGVDLTIFDVSKKNEWRVRTRKDLGFCDEDFIIGSFQKDGVGWGDGMDPKPIKGPDIFIQVIDELYSKYPNIKVLLTGPSRGYVKTALGKKGVPYVHKLVNKYSDMPLYYSAIDAYFISSRVEGGPLSLPESWAMQVPLVSTKMGMPRDWICHGRNGFICEIDNFSGLGKSFDVVYNDTENVKEMTTTALRDVEKLKWKIIARQYADLVYSKII